jgi:hypothetical protein
MDLSRPKEDDRKAMPEMLVALGKQPLPDIH